MPISVRDYIRLSSAGGLGGAGGGVTLTQVQTEATTAATSVKTELSDADTAGKGANLIAYTKLSGETGVVAPQYPVGDVRRYGAKGDGNSRPLSTIYGSLGAAQAIYPHATALTNEIDWAAIQAAVENASARSVADNQVNVRIPIGRYIIHSPIRMRHNVALIGEGSPTIESIYAGTATLEKLCILTGSFHPQYYNNLASKTYNLQNISAGSSTITFSTASQSNNFAVGVPFVIRSSEYYEVGVNNAPVPVFHEANIPIDVNIASGVITLKYPIEESVTSPQAVQVNGSVNDAQGEPIVIVKNIRVEGLTFKPNASQQNRWLGNWGAIEAVFNNLNIINSRDLIYGNLLCRSSMTNITGQFSNRVVEIKTCCSHSVFKNISGTYVYNTAPDADPLFSIGEGTHSCVIKDISVDAGGWVANSVIDIQDVYRTSFENITIVAPNTTGAFMIINSRSHNSRLEDNRFSNITCFGGTNFTRWMNIGVSGASVSVPKRYRFQNVKFFGTPNGTTSSSAMLLLEGADFEFEGCTFENGKVPVQNNTKRFRFLGCDFLNRTQATTANSYTSHLFRGCRLSAWKDCAKVMLTATTVNSTTANNVVATYTQAVGARPEDGDFVKFSIEANITGTAGAKNIVITDDTGTLLTVTIDAATTGLHRINGRVLFRGNTNYTATLSLTNPAGAISTTRTARSGLSMEANGRTFTVQAWVANAADSIFFDMLSVEPVPLVAESSV